MMTGLAWAQGHETFDNFTETGTSYGNNTFTGQDGSDWSYTQCRGDYEINGKAIMIGRNRNPQSYFESGTITGGGIGQLKFKYMQAFATNVNLNVFVNGGNKGNFTSNNELEQIKESGVIDVNVDGDFVLKFINNVNGAGQVCVDDIEWTAYGEVFGDSEIDITSNLGSFKYVLGSGPSGSQQIKISGSNLTDQVTVSAPENYEVSSDNIFFGNAVYLT